MGMSQTMADDVPGTIRIQSKGPWQAQWLSQLTGISSVPPPYRRFPFTLPWHAGQIRHKFPQVFLSYSVMIASGREGQDGSASLITAPWREQEREFKKSIRESQLRMKNDVSECQKNKRQSTQRNQGRSYMTVRCMTLGKSL